LSIWLSSAKFSVYQLRLQRLFAGEGQKLADQAGRPIGVLFYLYQVGKRGVSDAVSLEQQIGKANHGSQKIVKVMRDPAGQLSDRLHLLSLSKLKLKIFLLGCVDQV